MGTEKRERERGDGEEREELHFSSLQEFRRAPMVGQGMDHLRRATLLGLDCTSTIIRYSVPIA